MGVAETDTKYSIDHLRLLAATGSDLDCGLMLYHNIYDGTGNTREGKVYVRVDGEYGGYYTQVPQGTSS